VLELFTIGHSNLKWNDFLALLKAAGITLLIDVRSKPSSRWPQFQRDNLAKGVRSEGIEYLWGGRFLGGMNPIPPTEEMFVAKMEAILDKVKNGEKIALMCSEGKPCECHRAGKLTAWVAKYRPDVKVTHILRNGEIATQEAIAPTVKDFLRWPELDY
jgi:uncharacterized protein (DUF488 family)